MKRVLQKFNWKRFGIVIGGLLILALLPNMFQSEKPQEEVAVAEKAKKAQVLSFGEYQGNSNREVLGTVESSGFTQITARNNGTIQSIYVDIGSRVKKGALLAQYELANDTNVINYQNAQSSFETAKASAQNTIRSSEISLDTAQKTLVQMINTQDRIFEESYQNLNTKIQTTRTIFERARDYADNVLGASQKFRNEVSGENLQIGLNDAIGRQNAKNQTEELVRSYNNYVQSTLSLNSLQNQDQILQQAKDYLNFSKEIQDILNQIGNLNRNTSSNTILTETEKSNIQREIDGTINEINVDIVTLESQIQGIGSLAETRRQNILTAQNSVENAEAQLDLAQANANNQSLTAENQIRVASKYQTDLRITAPFSGKITKALTSENVTVTPGMVVFEMVSESVTPEILTFLSENEFRQLQSQQADIEIELSDGDVITTRSNGASISLSQDTQKAEVRFYPSAEEIGGGPLQIGSFVKVRIPIQSNNGNNIIPVSAISFEPDGAEVLVLNQEQIAQRKKVRTGKIVGDSIEILTGLEPGDQVVQYRNRINAGEKVEIDS